MARSISPRRRPKWRGPREGCGRRTVPGRSPAARRSVLQRCRRLVPIVSENWPGRACSSLGKEGLSGFQKRLANFERLEGSVPLGMPSLRPSWSVLLRRIWTVRPSRFVSRSLISSATSSERRKAPANPSRSRARSRRPSKESGICVKISLRSPVRGAGRRETAGWPRSWSGIRIRLVDGAG